MTQEQDYLDIAEVVSALDDVPALEELMLAAGYDVSSYSNLETGLGHSYVVCENETAARETVTALSALSEDWRDCLSAPVKSVDYLRLAREDWAESWKRFFHTFRASERLVVKPSWEEYAAGPGDLVLELDPGMCFGTGYHGTTKACLQYLDELAAKHGRMSFMDAGTGSGILSIGAHLLGYSPVVAFDYDPQAVTTAAANLAGAGFGGQTTIIEADVTRDVPLPPCRVVAANILAVVLVEAAERILALVEHRETDGYLILSGILAGQYPEVRERFTALGAEELSNRTIAEWQSGLFRIPAARH